ncbi:hypothetical protein ACEPPN_016905 [Leptodophora sp. 'Broadleaf-Isolate-01']
MAVAVKDLGFGGASGVGFAASSRSRDSARRGKGAGLTVSVSVSGSVSTDPSKNMSRGDPPSPPPNPPPSPSRVLEFADERHTYGWIDHDCHAANEI